MMSLVFEVAEFRDFFVIATFIIATLGFQLCIYLFAQGFNKRIEAKRTSFVFLSFGFLFSGYIIGFTLLLIIKLWIPKEYADLIFKIAWLMIVLGLSLFNGIMETLYRLSLKIPYLFTTCSVIVFPFIFFFDKERIFYYIAVILIIIALFGQFGFLIYYVYRAPHDSKKYFVTLLVGTALVWLGIVPMTTLFSFLVPFEESTIIFIVLVLMGELITLYTVTHIEIFSITDWKSNLLELYVISQMPSSYQRVLYYMNFKNDPKFQTPNALVSGGILGLEKILANFSDLGTHVKVVEQEETDILLEYRPKYVICLIVKYKLPRIHEELLAEITKKFSKFYDHLLATLDFESPFTKSLFNGFESEVKNIINNR